MDYLAAVKDQKTAFADLHGRMDTDKDLVYLSKYTLTDVNDKQIPHAVSVTLNDPAVFAANVESSLNNATEQVTVESDDKNLDTAYIEDVVKASFNAANLRLIKQGRFALNPFLDQQMCRRGRGAARCLFRMEKDELVTDIVPWDTRYVYYTMGANGLSWAAYETYKSKGEIEAELWAQEHNFTISGKGATVLDVWDTDHNEIWVDTRKVYEQAHGYGFTPVALQVVPMGSMLADKDSLKYQGESIFFLIRDLVPELNRLVSIIQSLNLKALDNALLWKSKDGVDTTPPAHKDLTTPGAVTSADIGGGAEPVAYGELKRSAYLLHTMIETRIQRGSLSSIDMGTLSFPLSAVALIEIGEGRDQVFLPRLGSRGFLKKQLAEMMIAQLIEIGGSIEIGSIGHKRSFTTGKLIGEYDIDFKYFIKSPKVDAARLSMAAAAGNLIPDKAKRREILQREDPERDERQLRWEEAELLSPAVKIHRTIKALLEIAKRGDKDAGFEAEVLSAEMGANLKRMMGGGEEQLPKPEGGQNPTQLMPLMGGRGGSAKRPPEPAVPREEE